MFINCTAADISARMIIIVTVIDEKRTQLTFKEAERTETEAKEEKNVWRRRPTVICEPVSSKILNFSLKVNARDRNLQRQNQIFIIRLLKHMPSRKIMECQTQDVYALRHLWTSKTITAS